VTTVTYLFIINKERKRKSKENQKKKNIKSRKIDKRKKNISIQAHHNTHPSFFTKYTSAV